MGFFGGKKKADISAQDAAKMKPTEILKEIRKGRTVTGFSPQLAEHLGNGKMKNKPIKDIDKDYARRGSFDYEGVIKKHGDVSGLLAGFKSGGRVVARPLSESMHPKAYQDLLHKEAKRQGLI